MPCLSVNHTRLRAVSAVPTPLLALEVHRAGMPGQQGAGFWKGTASHTEPVPLGARGRISSSTASAKPSSSVEWVMAPARKFTFRLAFPIAIPKPHFQSIGMSFSVSPRSRALLQLAHDLAGDLRRPAADIDGDRVLVGRRLLQARALAVEQAQRH